MNRTPALIVLLIRISTLKSHLRNKICSPPHTCFPCFVAATIVCRPMCPCGFLQFATVPLQRGRRLVLVLVDHIVPHFRLVSCQLEGLDQSARVTYFPILAGPAARVWLLAHQFFLSYGLTTYEIVDPLLHGNMSPPALCVIGAGGRCSSALFFGAVHVANCACFFRMKVFFVFNWYCII